MGLAASAASHQSGRQQPDRCSRMPFIRPVLTINCTIWIVHAKDKGASSGQAQMIDLHVYGADAACEGYMF